MYNVENYRDAIKLLNYHISLKITVTNLPLQLKIKKNVSLKTSK